MRTSVVLVCAALLLVACEREQRRFSTVAPAAGRPMEVTRQATSNPDEHNAWDVAQGKQLYEAYNCNGCHASGGGAMGPALMDAIWLYGSEPRDVYTSIVQGRPNGMPAFGGRIPDEQVWQLVAYVRSMSGPVRADVRPTRSDHMRVKESEQARRPDHPVTRAVGGPMRRAARVFIRHTALAAVAVGAAACSGRMPVLDPRGPQAARIATYWWIAFGLSAVVLAVVLAVLVHTVARRRIAAMPASGTQDPRVERRLALGVGVAVSLTALTLVVLLVTSIATGRALHDFGSTRPLTIEVTGHQWWWDVEYWDPVPSQRVRTANEVHIPVGRPVLVKTRSLDVIHSFWVPALHGKKDNIPGHGSSLTLQADHAGTFAGHCAEFCGVQHAHMQLLVVAEPPDAFEAWLQAQRASAAVPTDAFARRGFDVFMNGPCALCHTVLGTRRAADAAPI